MSEQSTDDVFSAIPAAPKLDLSFSKNALLKISEMVEPSSSKFDEPMSRHTTLRMGGPADLWFEPATKDELSTVVIYCAKNKIPVTSVGGGSNLLVRDGGIRGVVLSTKRLREIERRDNSIRVSAGVSTGKVLSMATAWELGGVEFLGGVPGSVGGGLVMNAGTYLGEFKDVTGQVTSIDLSTGESVLRNNKECGFAYRRSALPRTEIVVEAVLDLKPRPKAEISETVRALRDRRKEREPQKVSNAGSAFKNPPDDFAGRLIEAVNFKGKTIGSAQCSPAHANWFVNLGEANSKDMLELLRSAWCAVQKQHGINLELEWKLLGND